MPNFTLSTHAQSRYARLDVSVLVAEAVEAELKRTGQPVPAPVPLTAIIDTGATHTCIPPGTAAKLGLTVTGTSALDTASGKAPCNRYAVRILFPKNVEWGGTVAELPTDSPQTSVLIGCDILSHGVLIYNGSAKTFTLCLG